MYGDPPQIFQQKNSELLSQDRQLGTEHSYILNMLKKKKTTNEQTKNSKPMSSFKFTVCRMWFLLIA